MDEFNGQSPAPPAAALFFPLLLISLLNASAPVASDTSEVKYAARSVDTQILETSLTRLEKACNDLLQLEPRSAAMLPVIKPMRDSLARMSQKSTKLDLIQWFSRCIAHGTTFMPVRARAVGLEKELENLLDPRSARLTLEQSATRGAELFLANTMNSLVGRLRRRCIFTTTDSLRTGLASSFSTREGDEVWFLHSASVPVVLRPLDVGHYRLIGVAYIHGIMHGEVAEEPDRCKAVRKILIE